MKIVKSKLKHLLNSIVLLGAGTLIFASTSYGAGTILSEESDIGGGNHNSRGYNSQTVRDAINLSWADNNTTQWQELGTNGGLGDYGVSWSTNGGSDFGHDNLYVGQNVTFKFNMHSQDAGTHYANFMKGWIDWNTTAGDNASGRNLGGTYVFDNDNDVVAGEKILRLSEGAGLEAGYAKDLVLTYNLTLTQAHVGTAYLRARVTCSESIHNVNFNHTSWSGQWNHTLSSYRDAFDAFSDYGQGEIEDWKFTVSGNQVPEPATMLLFGFGLLGLARIGRKKT